ncbi:MAG: mucoidy inhibitor MuiA family protein [Bacteroidales bacterium]|nr:mucoidy inhibitor MuiA family protein [Bacteroidales bacterium]
MKNIILILAVLLSASCFAQQAQTLDSKVTNVTLFLSGAQVTRAAQATLKAGISELTFTGLSENIDANTIRLTGEGSFTIISVNSRVNYLKTQKTVKDEESLKGKKKQLEIQIEDIVSQQGVLATEENLLKANQKIGTPDKGTTTLELKSAADFFRARFTELSEKRLELSRKQESWQEELNKIDAQLGEANQEEVKPTGEIMVQVMAKEAMNAKFKVSYLVRAASWKPEFDLRLDDISQPLELSRRAKISQNSGEDWQDVKLTLSTGNPNESGTEPRLSSWYLGGNTYNYSGYSKNKSYQPDQSVVEKPVVGYSLNGIVNGKVFDIQDGSTLPGVTIIVKGTTNGVITDRDGKYSINAKPGSVLVYSFIGMKQVSTMADNPIINIGMQYEATNLDEIVVTAYGISGESSSEDRAPVQKKEVIRPQNLQIESNDQQQVRSVKEYVISMPMSMPSDGKEYNLVIGAETIKAAYEFHSTPKLDRDAFLVAKVINWQDYDLLDATAGVFYEGTFTGKTRLSASLATDTLDISLGRDRSIMIERKKVKDYTTNQFMGSNRTVQRALEISLRNNKKQTVTLIVFDQYPVSKEKDIEVELVENGGARVEKETGMLRWEIVLEPGQVKKLVFKYTVKYPKERILAIE